MKKGGREVDGRICLNKDILQKDWSVPVDLKPWHQQNHQKTY